MKLKMSSSADADGPRTTNGRDSLAMEEEEEEEEVVDGDISQRGDTSGHNGSGGGRAKSTGRSVKRFHDGSRKESNRRTFHVGSRLRERDIGVTEFISEHSPISGILKDRYTDFHVNEIGYDQGVAKLTNQDIPLQEGSPLRAAGSEPMATLPKEVLARLEKLSSTEGASATIEIDVTEMSKDERRAIHGIAKRAADVGSETVDRDGRKIIVISRDKTPREDRREGRNSRRDQGVSWENGDYCYFLLHKMNIDTMSALNRLASGMKLKSNSFAYAGTKDRRAWTTQWVSLKRVTPAAVLRAAKSIRGLYVGNFRFEREPLRLGRLRGNRFRIALRNITAPDDEIARAMTSLADEGFINYYGLQRFGTVAAVPTYEIGKKLLQGKWSEAIELILRPRGRDEQDAALAAAKKMYGETGDAAAACRLVRRADAIEAKLLRGLCAAGKGNPQGALDSIPRNTRLMYLHAYQSFLWNHMVSRRIREFGKKPIAGDLVYRTAEAEGAGAGAGEGAGEGDEAPERQEATDASPPEVKVLAREDLPNYALRDVLMPQPGWRVTYPPYAKPWLDELLARDEVGVDFRRRNMKYSLSGTYRRMLQAPSDLSWRIARYADRRDELIQPDIHEMRKLSAPRNERDGRYKALLVDMSLPPCTYATMALREILKQDTSAEVQAARSAAHDAEGAEDAEDAEEAEGAEEQHASRLDPLL